MKSRILYFCSPEPLPPLSEACLSLTPKVFIHKLHEAYLDIGVTEKHFGGEDNVLSQWSALNDIFKIKGQLVVTDRPEWARAFALDHPVILPVGTSQQQLLSLYIDRLAYCGHPIEDEINAQKDLVSFMKRVGMRIVSDFAKLSATAIGRRFGNMGMQLHQSVMGTRQVCLPNWVPTDALKDSMLADQITCLESLLFYLEQVLTKMEARLRGRNLFAKTIKLSFHLDSGEQLNQTFELSEPMQNAERLLSLFKEFLAHTTWNAPLESFDLEVTDSTPSNPGQLSLFDMAENKRADLDHYIQRLRARFGDTQVGFAKAMDHHLPERSWTVSAESKTTNHFDGVQAKRPVFLYSPARPYSMPPNAKLTPTENLAVDWWEESYGYRRYFTVRYGTRADWVFWDNQKQAWFLHGSFD